MTEKLRINFVLPPSPAISGGPLAILEYASRLMDRGHSVSITTHPDSMWTGKSPFPWFDFKGPIHFKELRSEGRAQSHESSAIHAMQHGDMRALSAALLGQFQIAGLRELILQSGEQLPERLPFEFLTQEILTWLQLMDAMPECDLNIATLWSTTIPVFFSKKGKPVYFMQHYEEIFYPLQPAYLMHRLGARLSYMLPVYKVANSSWLQKVIKERYGQDVPFSNNGLELSDFAPAPKASESDGIIRVFTYSRPEEWKGFGDAIAAMSMIRARYGDRVEWNVFGYKHPNFPEDNPYVRYKYHPKLSFRDLAQLYARSDISLCPSWYESFPLPPLEAMASGTAVVTTDYGTEDYAFHEQNALVVGSRQIDAMYAALCRLVEDKPLRDRLAKAGYQTAQEFTWERAVERRERILLDIHRGHPGYDVMGAAKLGLTDYSGTAFEHFSSNGEPRASGIFWYHGDLYLMHNGMKRHVTTLDVVPTLLARNARYINPDSLTVVRTPMGFPISSPADVPAEL